MLESNRELLKPSCSLENGTVSWLPGVFPNVAATVPYTAQTYLVTATLAQDDLPVEGDQVS